MKTLLLFILLFPASVMAQYYWAFGCDSHGSLTGKAGFHDNWGGYVAIHPSENPEHSQSSQLNRSFAFGASKSLCDNLNIYAGIGIMKQFTREESEVFGTRYNEQSKPFGEIGFQYSFNRFLAVDYGYSAMGFSTMICLKFDVK